jgi:hypothetical protein
MGRPMLKVVNGIGEATLLFLFFLKLYTLAVTVTEENFTKSGLFITLHYPHHRFEQILTPTTLFQKPQNKLGNRDYSWTHFALHLPAATS